MITNKGTFLMRTFATMLASVAALTFVAACTSTSPGDEVLTKSELRQLITGKSVSFDGGGTATYYRDGRYKYVLNGADTGTYSFRNDQVCVAFDGGGSRCASERRAASVPATQLRRIGQVAFCA